MEFPDVVRQRRMVRRYDQERPVPQDVVDRLLAAALRAPSAGNTGGVSFLVLRESGDLQAYWAATARTGEPDRWLRGMRTAPLLVLVWTSEDAYLDRYAEPDKGWTDRDQARWSAPYWFVDAGMASMAALLSVVDSGLAACFFGVPVQRVAAVRAVFGVPANQLSVGAISVGYPDPAVGAQPGGRAPRRPRAERVHCGRW